MTDKKTASLRKKFWLLICGILFIIVAAAASGGAAWFYFVNDDLNERGELFAQNLAITIDNFTEKQSVYTQSLIFILLAEVKDGDMQRMKNTLQFVHAQYEGKGLFNAFIVDESDGRIVDAQGFYENFTRDVRNTDWYKQAASSKTTMTLPPYIDPHSNQLVYNVLGPIMRTDGELLGVVGVVFTVESFVAPIALRKFAEDGFSFCVGRTGAIWNNIPGIDESLIEANSDGSYRTLYNVTEVSGPIMSSFAAAGERMLKHETGWADVMLGGREYRLFFAPTQTGFVAAHGFALEHIFSFRNRVVISVILIILAIFGMASFIFRPVLNSLDKTVSSILQTQSMVQKNLQSSHSVDVGLLKDMDYELVSLQAVAENVQEQHEKASFAEFKTIFGGLRSMLEVISEQRQDNVAQTEEIFSKNEELSSLNAEVKFSYQYLILKLQEMAGIYHLETASHLERVSGYCELIAHWLGKPEGDIKDMGLFSKVHDLGKVRVDINLLSKEGPLTPDEMNVVKNHTIWGAQLVGEAPWLEMARNICLYHHERYDGTGYPYGLKGEEIPWESLAVSIADIYDALRSKRCYKPGMSHADTVKIILNGDGRTQPEHFSPKMLEFFKAKHEEMEIIYELRKE